MTIALLGQPNSGKSTLYNHLTGSHQHVGNWPGKTVEKNEGEFTIQGTVYHIIDLPGTYSLSANSDEEIVTRDYIAGGSADTVTIFADSSQLERSLFMLADYAGIRVPAILLLNMMDVAKAQGKTIDSQLIAKRLGIPVVSFIAQEKNQYDTFFDTIRHDGKRQLNYDMLDALYRKEFGNTYEIICAMLPEDGISVYSRCWLFAKLAEKDKAAGELVRQTIGEKAFTELTKITDTIQNGSSRTGSCKFQWIDSILSGAIQGADKKQSLSGFDKAATSPFWGKLLAIVIIIGSLLLSIGAGYPLMWLGNLMPSLADPIEAMLLGGGAHPLLVSLLCDGLWTAIAFTVSMCGYVFGATLVFGLLEEIGYMARISYVFDGTMRRLGLHGKAVMPFLVSFGCNISGSTGSRVLDKWSQRMTAIALSWVVPCGSTWAVLGLFGSVFFGPWVIVIVLSMFALSLLHLWLTSALFGRRLLRDSDRTGLIMELPPYHKPRWGNLIVYSLRRMWSAFRRALGIVVIFSVILCLLSYSPDGNMSNSLLGKAGSFIQPVTMIFGLRWETFIAWLASLMGKEGALGAIAAVFNDSSVIHSVAKMSVESPDEATLAVVLAQKLTIPEALAFMFAFYFNMPCIMTLSAAMHETHSRKWTLSIAAYYVAAALVISSIVYHVALLFF